MARMLRPAVLVGFFAVLLGQLPANAQNATWLLSPTSGNFETAANWSPPIVPTGTATFGLSNTTTITFSAVTAVGTLQFNTGAPAYTFDISSGTALLINGTGIVNNSSNSPTLSSSALIVFLGVTAGNAIIINFGLTEFSSMSTAGNATITTNSGGVTFITDISTGGDARFITNAGGTFDISGLTSPSGTTAGSIEGAGTYQLGSKALTVGLNNLSTEVSGTIVDGGLSGGTGGSLIKVGTGTLTLTGANTYSGGTSLNGGILAVDSDGNLGTGALSFNGGTLEALVAGGGITSSKAVTLNTGGGTFLADAGTSSTLSGAISGSGSFTMSGSGTLALTGANTYSGGTNLSGGTLAVDSDANLGTGALSFNGGTLEALTAGGGITSSKAVTLNTGGGTFLADAGTSSILSGVIGGLGSFTKEGSGTLALSGNNTYSGATTVASGTLQAGSSTAFSGNSAFIVTSLLDLHGFSNTIGSLSGNGTVTNNGAAPAVLTVANNNTTFGGIVEDGTARLGLTKSGTATLILTGNNTYSGGTTISGGTLQLGNGGASGSIVGNVVDNGVFAINRSNTYTFAGNISGAGAFHQLGAGTTILTGTNTYTGGTTIAAGTLQIGNGGTIGSIVGNVTDNGTLDFDRSDLATFGGVISGTGALVQSGSGTLALTANDTYSGGTTIDPGDTLQIGNGGTTGSITGNVTDNGSLAFDRSNSLTFNSVISGSGTVVQNGFGTIILGGTNTYTGGTDINNGTLLVNNAQALGLGNVVVNGGVLGADPQPINVKGNYTQNAGGTLELQIAGANPGQYDTLNVTRNASLGGTLQLSNLGFQPIGGDRLTLVSTGGVVTSKFGQFVDPFPGTGPTYNIVELVYGMDSVLLEFLTVPPPVPPPPVIVINFESFAQTPNEKAAGNLLDAIQLDPKAADLMAYLYKQPFSSLPGDLAQISPDALTSFYEITFSNANIQRLNIEGRLDDLRAGSTGFTSNMNLKLPPVSPEGKAAKSPVEQALQPTPENRWGIWVTGFGDFVNVDGDYNAHGYDFTTGGVTVGVDYRITDQFAIGAMGEYAHTWTSLKPSGEIDVNSGRGGVYATWFTHGFYLNGAIYGGGADYSSGRATLGGMANGSTSGAEYSAFISGGYDFHCGHLTIGPTAALQYTYINIDSFDEHGSLAPLNIHSQSAESLRTDCGARAIYVWQVGKVLVEPSLRAAWEHEYKYSNLPITAGFAGIPGPSDTFYGPSEGHDSAIVSAGVLVNWTPMIGTYVNYDGQLGRNRYDSNAVTGGVRISF
jgi:outer membrane autotransporter protein